MRWIIDEHVGGRDLREQGKGKRTKADRRH
jgi:hypothetical protein